MSGIMDMSRSSLTPKPECTSTGTHLQRQTFKKCVKKQEFELKVLISILLFIFLFAGCKSITEPQTGTIYVLVVDNGDKPVSGIKITITPDNLTKYTNEKGVCTFDVAPGSHYVNAQLNGPGPSIRTIHKLVEVKSRKTVKVKLTTCPMCV